MLRSVLGAVGPFWTVGEWLSSLAVAGGAENLGCQLALCLLPEPSTTM